MLRATLNKSLYSLGLAVKKISLLISIIMLVSCSHSGYTPDNVVLPVPKTWDSNNDRYTNTHEDLVNMPWWHQFEDPTLNQLVDQALNHNNDIQVAMANVEAAHGELKRVQLQWVPEVTAAGGYSSWPDVGYPGVLLSVVPIYTLNIFKQIKEQKQAGYELKATEAMEGGVRLAVIGQVSASYLSYIAQIEQLQLLFSLEKDLEKLVEITQKMHARGLYSQTEVERALSALHRIEARIKVVQHNIVISKNAVHYLLNKAPGNLTPGRTFQQLTGDQMIIGALPLNVIENRPDMQQAAQELAAANERIGVAFSHLLPTIDLRGAYGETATVPDGYKLGESLHFNEALVQIPVLRASVYGELEKTKGLNKASYYRYTDTLVKVLQEVNNDLSAHDLYTKRLDELLKTEQHTQEVYNLRDDLYQRGIISLQALLEEKILLDELAIEVNQYKLDQFITIVNLYQDLAVGYRYQPKQVSNEDY